MSTQHTPPMQKSEESTEKQLELARKQGEAYAAALEAMNKESGADIKRAGEYEVTIVVEKAEGLYELKGEELVWQKPKSENAHIEVAVRDAADGRFIPELTVMVTVPDANGKEVGRHQQPFLWHPWIYHYGRNWEVPGEGEYQIHVRIEPPTFMRHDPKNGKRFNELVEVSFNRHIKPGQK